MDRQILMEKQRNSELEKRIKQLEAEAKQVNVPGSVPHVPPVPPSNPEPSKLELLLEKAMDRMTTIEEQLKQQPTRNTVETPEPHVASSKAGETKRPDDAQDGDQSQASDGSDTDEDDVENFITTPDGQRVPLIISTTIT